MPQIRASLDTRSRKRMDLRNLSGLRRTVVHMIEEDADDMPLSAEDYQKSLNELRALLNEAKEDERAGRFSPAEEAYARLKEALRNGTL